MVMATSHSLFSFFFLMIFFIQVSSKSYYHYYYHYPSFYHSHPHFRLRPHPFPPPLSRLNSWKLAHATFYGDMQGGETMQGACGYGDLFQQGYGLETTALSTALFNNGLTCGACFEIQCVNDPQWCIEGAGTIKVTATNFCPPNYDPPNFDHWCNPPQEHFDLSMKMFTQIAIYKAGIIPVQYRRVPCTKTGGVRFEIKGNPYWLLVLIYNVGNAGDVCQVSIKGSQGNWVPMTRAWGQNWLTGFNLVGQCMSFMVTTSDGKTLEFDNVVPSDWQFGQTHEAGTNF